MRALLHALWCSRSGVALVEFAIAVPVLVTLYLGAFVLSDEISANRKVTVAARTVADLTTRYASMTTTQLATIMGSSAQVLAPYPVNNASVRVTEVLVTGSTSAQVVWSQTNATGGTSTIPALTIGSTITLPANMATTGTYLVLGEVSYTYTPAIGLGVQSAMTLYDKSFMSPRLSNAIPLS